MIIHRLFTNYSPIIHRRNPLRHKHNQIFIGFYRFFLGLWFLERRRLASDAVLFLRAMMRGQIPKNSCFASASFAQD